jgi:hypothetical protein
MKEFFKKEAPTIYQSKLAHILHQAVKESKKKEYIVDNNEAIVVLMSYSIYSNVLPLTALLTLIALFIQYTNIRLAILYETRRPVNRS